MNRRTTLRAAGEIAAWWAALALLWLVFISAVDRLELAVGAGVAALAARAARRAVTGR
jgi:multisubunit Na+/H+ antiporter MnhE subunit